MVKNNLVKAVMAAALMGSMLAMAGCGNKANANVSEGTTAAQTQKQTVKETAAQTQTVKETAAQTQTVKETNAQTNDISDAANERTSYGTFSVNCKAYTIECSKLWEKLIVDGTDAAIQLKNKRLGSMNPIVIAQSQDASSLSNYSTLEILKGVMMEQVSRGYQVTKANEISLDGVTSYRYLAYNTTNGEEIDYITYLTVKNDVLYTLVGAASPEDSKYIIEIVKDMSSTWKWK